MSQCNDSPEGTRAKGQIGTQFLLCVRNKGWLTERMVPPHQSQQQRHSATSCSNYKNNIDRKVLLLHLPLIVVQHGFLTENIQFKHLNLKSHRLHLSTFSTLHFHIEISTALETSEDKNMKSLHKNNRVTPLTSHRRCAGRAVLWGFRSGPDICCRSRTACQSGGRLGWE